MAAQTPGCQAATTWGEPLPENEANPKENRAKGTDHWPGTERELWDPASLNLIHPRNFPVTQANHAPLYETVGMGFKPTGS